MPLADLPSYQFHKKDFKKAHKEMVNSTSAALTINEILLESREEGSPHELWSLLRNECIRDSLRHGIDRLLHSMCFDYDDINRAMTKQAQENE